MSDSDSFALAAGDRSLLPDSKLPRRQVLADGVYETIKSLIMDHWLVPGSRINMDALARELDVSATPVREALARLDADGLVTKRPLAGYMTAPLLDAVAFEHLYEMRMLLEPDAARLAAARITGADLADLATELDEAEQQPPGDAYATYRVFADRDAAFHHGIASAAGNPLLRDAVARLRAHMHVYRLYFRAGIAVDTMREHQRIFGALRDGNPEMAARAMTAHVRSSRERLVRFV
ncbi:MAG: GntR family transcriptional regulator [Nocardioidaceae bacterium]